MWPRASASTIHPRTNDFVSPQPQNLSVTEIKWRSLLAAAPPFLGTVGHLEGPGLPCPQGSLWPGLQLAAPAGSRACCSKLRTEPAPTSVLRIKMKTVPLAQLRLVLRLTWRRVCCRAAERGLLLSMASRQLHASPCPLGTSSNSRVS